MPPDPVNTTLCIQSLAERFTTTTQSLIAQFQCPVFVCIMKPRVQFKNEPQVGRFIALRFHCINVVSRYGSHPGVLASAPLPPLRPPQSRRRAPGPCSRRHTGPRPGPASSGSRRYRSTPRCSPTAPPLSDSTTWPGAGH